MDNLNASDNKVEEKNLPAVNTSLQKPDAQKQTQLDVKETAPVAETDKEINWKKFKEARELERKQAEEVARRAAEKEAEVLALKAAMDAILNKPNGAQNQSNQGVGYEYEEETEDQKIEKKVNALLAKREAEAAKRRREEEEAQLPMRLKSSYKDFDQVCSSGNLDYLEYHHPELAKSLGSQPQSFDKWNDIYNAIKRYVPNIDARKEQVRAENNLNKPQSISSTLASPGSSAMPVSRLDDSRKAANWERMQKLLKGLN